MKRRGYCHCTPENAPCEWCEDWAELAEPRGSGDVEVLEVEYERWLDRIAGE